MNINTTDLTWRRVGTEWHLLAGKRRMGRVLPDQQHPGMWRSVLNSGRLSDMANLSWAKSTTLDAATREIEWDIRQRASRAPAFTGQNEGGLEQASSLVRFQAGRAITLPSTSANA